MVDPVRGPVKIQGQSPGNKVMMRPADQVRQPAAGAAGWAGCSMKVGSGLQQLCLLWQY
jgi:hypothetical protein